MFPYKDNQYKKPIGYFIKTCNIMDPGSCKVNSNVLKELLNDFKQDFFLRRNSWIFLNSFDFFW